MWSDVDRSRHRMDALKGWVMNAVIYQDPDDSNRCFEKETWVWVKEIHTKVCRELDYSAVYHSKSIGDGKYIIDGKQFSRDYVRSLYWELQCQVDELIEQLSEFYYMLPLATACSTVFDSPHEYLEESKKTPKRSFQALFSINALRDLEPRPKDVLRDAVLGIIDTISYHLMAMVYIASCGPYRFPEIRVLRVSGPQKNIFVDDKLRRIQLLTNYTKNGNNKPLAKELDKNTSDYLFYFLTVIKTIQISLLEDYDQVSQDIFGESVDGVEAHLYSDGLQDMTPYELSQQVIRQFVFVDIAIAKLCEYSKFKKLLMLYPSNIAKRQRLNFRSMRHGMIGLLRDYVSQHYNSEHHQPDTEIIETMAGHSAQTGLKVYAVDETRLSEIAQEQILISRAYVKYLALEDLKGIRKTEETRVAKPVVNTWHPRTSMKKLRCAIQAVYGVGFQFRSEQQTICHDIYMSGSQVIAVQALTGFGKTAVFQLPLVAMRDENAVSFVFVPYTVLQSDLEQRLAKGGLKVGRVKALLDNPSRGSLQRSRAKRVCGAASNMGF